MVAPEGPRSGVRVGLGSVRTGHDRRGFVLAAVFALAVFVVAALITPGADPLSQVLVAVPMMGLYILSIGIAWVFRKRKVAEPTT